MFPPATWLFRSCFFVFLGLALTSQGQLYWGGTAADVWTASKWGTSPSGPFDQPWVSGSAAVFNQPSSAISGASTAFSSITANESVTVTAAGTLATGGTVATLTVAGGKTLNLQGQALSTAAGTGFIKEGDGTLSIGNGNSYTGGFTVNAGAVTIGGVNALGNGGALTINGGTLQATSARNLTGKFGGGITVGGNFSFGGSAALTFSDAVSLGAVLREITNNATATITNTGVISSSGGGLSVRGTGTMTLGGANNFTGGLTLNSGVLNLTANNSFDGGLTVNGGTNVIFGAQNFTGGVTLNGGQINIGNDTATFNNSGGTLTLNGGSIFRGQGTSAQSFANAVAITENSTVYGNPASGSRIIVWPTGSITVNSGKSLTIRNVGGVAGTTFELRLNGGGYDLSGPIVIGLPGDGAGTAMLASRSDNSPAGDQTISGLMSGTGKFARNVIGASIPGANTYILNASNSYSGGTDIRAGFIGVGATNCLGTGRITVGWDPNPLGFFPHGGPRLLTNDCYSDVLSTSATTAPGSTNLQIRGADDMTFSGRFAIHTNTMFFTINNTAITTFSGVMTNVLAFSAGVYKQGPGTMVMSGNNTYAGVTTVGEGTLLINNVSGSGTSTGAVSVIAGATLGGTGTIAGAVTLSSATMSPGASAGALSLQSGLDLSSGSAYTWELAANTTSGAGVNYDVINRSGGNLVLGGSSRLQLNFVGSATFPDATNSFWQQNHAWTIITGSGSAANPGSSNFAIIEGTNGCTAGTFTTSADASGNVVLLFTSNSPQPPTINQFSYVGGNLIFSGINGTPGNPYVVVTSTNVTAPLATWTREVTNLFDGGGGFSVTNAVSPGSPRKFYTIWLP